MPIRLKEEDKEDVDKKPESQGALVREILAGGSSVARSSSQFGTLNPDGSDLDLSDWIAGLEQQVEELNLPTSKRKKRGSHLDCRK